MPATCSDFPEDHEVPVLDMRTPDGRHVAVLFGYPLRAGAPKGRSNKILWIVRYPRRGTPLRIHAEPLAGSAHAVSALWPADSSSPCATRGSSCSCGPIP